MGRGGGEEGALYICLNLGVSVYGNHQWQRVEECFDRAAAYPDDAVATKLNVARNILTLKPYSKEAVAILDEITEAMPGHCLVLQMQHLDLGPKGQYERFGDDDADGRRDREFSNRATYHEILNEIGLFKDIDQRLARKSDSKELPSGHRIHRIHQRGDQPTAQCRQRSGTGVLRWRDMIRVLQTISDTTQDIYDFVNNEIAILEQRVCRLLKRDGNAASKDKLQRLLGQVEFTQGVLNDLGEFLIGAKVFARPGFKP